MKNLIIEFMAVLEDARLVDGKKGQYIALRLKQGYNSYSTYTKEMTVIDLLPGDYIVSAKIKEFGGKYNLEVLSLTK